VSTLEGGQIDVPFHTRSVAYFGEKGIKENK
jgi:hypothetical protein